MNASELPAQCSVCLLLLLANALMAWHKLIKVLKVNFMENGVLFALKLLIAKVLGSLLHLHMLSMEVAVHENKHCMLAWIFLQDVPCT